MGRLDGKVVVITGGAGGQGVVHSRLFVDEGAKVVISDLNEEVGNKLADELGENAYFIKHDVASESDWKKVVDQTVEKFGSLDVLVNNAGITFSTPMEELTEESFQKIISINQISVFLGMRAVLPAMKENGGGSIVNIASIGSFVGTPGSFAYDATKFAVRGMTKTAAIELAKYGVRVNSVHPGMIDTEMLRGLPQEVQDDLEKGIPVRRFAQPEEVSKMVLYLASDDSTYSTGSEFVVDGGYLA